MIRRKLSAQYLYVSASAVFFVTAASQSALAQTQPPNEGNVETVYVTGTRQQAQQVKEDAPNLLEIRPVDEVQKLPDVDIAEALQRVPGVSMESDTGEGRYINIRGMDADLNGTTFDGVRLTTNNPSSPQGGARAVAFDVLPPGLFGGVEVIKSLTPDIDAEGLGGIVNLLPRTLPNGRDFLVDASAGSGTETLRGSPVWDGQLTVGGRFGDHDQFSIIASYAFHEDWRGIDDIENGGVYPNYPSSNIEESLEYRWYKYHRTRRGEGTSMTWDVDGSASLFLRAFDAGYTEYAFKDRLEIDNLNVLNNGNTPVQNPDGSYTVDDVAAEKRFTDSKETIESKLVEVGGHKVFADDILADFRLSWTEGHDLQPWSYKFTFTDPHNILFNYNPTTNPNYPSFQTLDGTNLADPSIYTKSKLEVDGSDNMDSESALAGNVTVPVSIAGNDGDFKFGFNVRLRVIRQNATQPGEVKNVGPLSKFASTDQIFYNDLYNIGPMANLPELAAIPESPQIIDPSQFEHNSEKVYAEYVQYTTTIGKLSLLGGVRLETTNAIYAANLVNGDTDTTINEFFNKQDYTNVFPDLNAKYQVDDDLIVRGTFTTSLARPGFNEITAATSYNYGEDTVSVGNPTLKPITADNIDLTGEYYLPQGGIAAVGLFYKAFQNYIVPTNYNTTVGAFPTAIANNFAGIASTPVQVSSFVDIGAASAKGIELNYQQQFIFLPGWLSGFGVDTNMTYNDSNGQIRPGEYHALPQTSPWNYNAAIYYEKYGLSLRIAASYVSKNLWSLNAAPISIANANSSPAFDLYSQPRFRLDFGSSYAFNDNFEFYFNVKNITNTKLEFTQTPSANFPVQREFYNTDYLFGIKAHF